MAKHTVTQEDLDNNPELVERNVQVGEEIDLPEDNIVNDDKNSAAGGAAGLDENTTEQKDEAPSVAQKPLITPPGATEPLGSETSEDEGDTDEA